MTKIGAILIDKDGKISSKDYTTENSSQDWISEGGTNNPDNIHAETNIMISNKNLSFEEAKSLPLGTILVEASTHRLKEKNKVYCIVTESGINHFQYSWYKNKFDFDPASLGVGIPVTIFQNSTKFIEINIPPIDIHARNNKKPKFNK